MGYMTTITILNDAWSTIKEHPEEFIENIDQGMNGLSYFNGRYYRKHINSYGVGNHCNPMEVAQSHHADDVRLYLVGQNMMSTFGYFNDIKDIKLRKSLLRKAKWILEQEEKQIKELEEKLKS